MQEDSFKYASWILLASTTSCNLIRMLSDCYQRIGEGEYKPPDNSEKKNRKSKFLTMKLPILYTPNPGLSTTIPETIHKLQKFSGHGAR